MSTAETVTCPRCWSVAPLEGHTGPERHPAVGTVGWVTESMGVLAMLAGYSGMGSLVTMVGGILLVLKLQTPTGSCGSCGAQLTVTVDWRGHWHAKEPA